MVPSKILYLSFNRNCPFVINNENLVSLKQIYINLNIQKVLMIIQWSSNIFLCFFLFLILLARRFKNILIERENKYFRRKNYRA